MQYKNSQKIIIDKRKLDILLRLGNYDKQILQLVKTGTFTKTGDELVDETLECLMDVKSFDNWGGKRTGSGRPSKNHLENQVDNHLENQDAIQVVDKDRDKDKLTNLNNIFNINNKSKIVISSSFKANDYDELKVYVQEMPEDVIHSVEQWLIKSKLGQPVDCAFIAKQFINFAKRQGRPFFKEGV
jgi:hypothetical protein